LIATLQRKLVYMDMQDSADIGHASADIADAARMAAVQADIDSDRLRSAASVPPDDARGRAFPLPWLIVALAAITFVAFVLVTPDGFLTKTDMVAYAVCHRITSHSFTIAGRQLPLCARCSGTFLGALTGFFGQAWVLRRRRAVELPSPLVTVVLAGFFLLWAADGLNSYLTLFPNAPHAYEPRNWLRLATGALNGLLISALVYPVFNFTFWRQPVPERAIRDLRDLGVLLLLEAAMVGLVLTRWRFLLVPLALLSAVGVSGLLTSVNSVLLLTLVRRENAVSNWREAAIPLLAGFTVSLIQIMAIGAVRYRLTGTLEGLPPFQ
jgi:uncharacterized membrane protein